MLCVQVVAKKCFTGRNKAAEVAGYGSICVALFIVLQFVTIFRNIQNQAVGELTLSRRPTLPDDGASYLRDETQPKVFSQGSSVGMHYNVSFWTKQLEKEHFPRVTTEREWRDERKALGKDLWMQPILQNNKEGGSFLFCTIPKVGCSRWRRLLRKAAGISDWNHNPHNPRTNGLQYVGKISNTTAQRHAVEDPDRIRVTIVRNPFSRILSAWLDKKDVVAFALPQNFTRFVHDVVLSNKVFHGSSHWKPQSNFCGMRSLKYDFIGQAESIGEWGDTLLRRLGLDEQAESGFGEDNKSFFGSSLKIGSPATGAGSKLKQYYDAELAQIVMKYYREDIDRFGYYDDYLELLDAVSVGKNVLRT